MIKCILTFIFMLLISYYYIAFEILTIVGNTISFYWIIRKVTKIFYKINGNEYIGNR